MIGVCVTCWLIPQLSYLPREHNVRLNVWMLDWLIMEIEALACFRYTHWIGLDWIDYLLAVGCVWCKTTVLSTYCQRPTRFHHGTWDFSRRLHTVIAVEVQGCFLQRLRLPADHRFATVSYRDFVKNVGNSLAFHRSLVGTIFSVLRTAVHGSLV